MRRDEYIAAVCAEWMSNGNQPVDGANDPREHVSSDYYVARRMAEECLDEGYFTDPNYDPDGYNDIGPRLVPTAKAWFEVFR